jgi:hypothetical protein
MERTIVGLETDTDVHADLTTDGDRPFAAPVSVTAQARPQPLQAPGDRRRDPADDGAGRHSHDYRPALGPAGLAHLGRQPPVGCDRLHPGVRGLLLLSGRVADHVGRKRKFTLGLGGFAAA